MSLIQLLLLPVSGLYGLAIFARNALFDLGLLESKRFKLPIISVGNLTVGGTGKTPHIEYLIRLLQEQFNIATLSRGYGRKTRNFLLSTPTSTYEEIGDEPRQFKQKFPELPVAVDGKRVRGIQQLQKIVPELQTILLDDAFQHRKVKPGLSILLTDYSNLFTKDRLLPSGTLREHRSGYHRADIIVVTKTPDVFSPMERRIINHELRPRPHQQLYFSYLKYGEFEPLHPPKGPQRITKDFYFQRNFAFLVVTGIANPDPMLEYLDRYKAKVQHIAFPDHHAYQRDDILKIKGIFDTFEPENKIILTTEKDAMRLGLSELAEETAQLPIFYLPVQVAFHERDEHDFNEQIINYVGRN